MESVLPKVSVVMSVFDCPDDVRATIKSVLVQEAIELELVIISDGAEASVIKTVREFSDSRIRFIEQSNEGLTKALILGCEEASYEAIARIDAGDVMLPGRLHKQAHQLLTNNRIALVACWVSVSTKQGDWLYDVEYSTDELREGISSSSVRGLLSPVHSSVMFRKSVYQSVGGYRWQFYFTQDCDLWPRLTQSHDIVVIQEVLQEIIFTPSGISGKYREYQSKLSTLVAEANLRRANSESESEILKRAINFRPGVDSKFASFDEFDGNYFIASVLENNGSLSSAIDYWRKALQIRPLSGKAWIRFWIAKLRKLLSLF